jgi:IclR family acetate operon transcriptional repressor
MWNIKMKKMIDNEELAIGLRCVAAPVFDYTGRPSYSISVAAPAIRITPELIERIQKDVKEIGAKFSAQLGMPDSDVKKKSIDGLEHLLI